MSWSPNVYSATIPAGMTGAGKFNLTPIAWGIVVQLEF